MKKIILTLLSLSVIGSASTVAAQRFLMLLQNMLLLLKQILEKYFMKRCNSTCRNCFYNKTTSTVYLVYEALENGSITLSTPVDISDYPYQLTTNSEASNVPMEARNYTVEELLEATLVSSANSAAIALAGENCWL